MLVTFDVVFFLVGEGFVAGADTGAGADVVSTVVTGADFGVETCFGFDFGVVFTTGAGVVVVVVVPDLFLLLANAGAENKLTETRERTIASKASFFIFF